MKRNLLFLLMALLPMVASAYDAKIGGICYNFSEDHAVVTHESNLYSGVVSIPKSVTYNGKIYPVTSIGNSAFSNCSNLTSVTIPESVTTIGHWAFQGCRALTDIVIPNGVTVINQGVFSNCTSLKSVNIPDCVTSIGIAAFSNCSSLASVTIPNGVTDIGNVAFGYCRSLTSITIPEGITSICYGTFQICSSLTSVIIPNSVTRIDGEAFSGCSSLTSVTIPNGVTNIESYAFDGCNSLTDVYCYAAEPPGVNTSFENVLLDGYPFNIYHIKEHTTLHVPASSLEKYKTALRWSDFGNIVALPEIYFPEGTKWTEIRIDTLKYDSWYSKVGDEWVPNFETIEYYVQGEYLDRYEKTPYKCVYSNAPEWTDSLTLLILEGKEETPNTVEVTVPNFDNDNWGSYLTVWPGTVYQFDWSEGQVLTFQKVLGSNALCLPPCDCYHYGIIEEIKEGYFGGVKPLKYVDLDGKAPVDPVRPWIEDTNGCRIIQGIGVTEWNCGECIFGPVEPYFAYVLLGTDPNKEPIRHYRSMLVHFERDGEVLYDVWPEKTTTGIGATLNDRGKMINDSWYDLGGRKLSGKPARGIYIENGKKKVK